MRRPHFMPELKEMRPFRYWCQKVLPLVYDDSLGYYELLNKVVDYINNMTKDVASLGESYQKLEEYVNSHLDTQYIKALVDEELDKMVEDGTFDEIVQTALDNKFNAYAETINDIIEEQNTTIDTRLDAQDEIIAGHTTTINNQQVSISRLNNITTTLSNTSSEHTSQIDTLDSDLSALSDDVDSISSTVSNQAESISSLQTSMNNATTTINNHTSAISSINSFIGRSVITLPHLDAPTVGGASSFSKDSFVAWLKYVVSHYGSEITNKPFMGKYTSSSTNLFVGFAYSMSDLVDGVPRYSFFITWSNTKTYVFGTYNGVAYFRESANYTDRT